MKRRTALLGAALVALVGGDHAATRASLALPGGRLDIGRIALSPAALLPGFVSPARAQDTAAAVVLDDVRWTAEGTRVVATRIEVAGTTLAKADLAALLDAASPLPLAERLTRLNASAVRIPELRVEQETAAGKQIAVYRDLRTGPVAQGRIATLDAAGTTLTAASPTGDTHGSYGPLSAADLDLPAMVRVYVERAEGGAMTRLYGRFALRDVVFTDPRGVVVKLAAAEGRDFAARPIKDSWRDAGRALAGVDLKRATPQARAAFMGTAADMLDGFAVGALELTGLEVAAANGQDGGSARIARVAYDGTARTIRAEKLAFAGNGARGSVETAALSGLTLGSTVTALRRQAQAPDAPPNTGALRDLAPFLENLHLDGLAFDLPAGEAPAAKPAAAWRAALRAIDLRMEAPDRGIPTASRLALDGLTLALPQGGRAGAFEPVAALGYRDLDLSAVLDSRWNTATGELTLRDLTLTGRDMGMLHLSGTMAGFTRDVLDPDSAVSSVALLGTTAKTLSFQVENRGLFERILAQQAKAQSLTSEALRREYGTAAAVGIPAILGNAPAARALGQAIARFVAKPGRLSVTATAKDPDGFGVADVSSAGSPAAMLERLTVTATAE